jgi:hypothetical protein
MLTELGLTEPPRAVAPWRVVQVPQVDGVPQHDRITSHRDHPGIGRAMRVELRQGDQTPSSGKLYNRAEVYGLYPDSASSTPAERWPLAPGTEHWFGWELECELPWEVGTAWLDFAQWKGLRGGSPPLAIEAHGTDLQITSDAGNRLRKTIGRLPLGVVTSLAVGVRFATVKTEGWVEVWRDGTQKLARTPLQTMDVVNGKPDPVYLKQGIYRSGSWQSTHVAWTSNMRVGDTREDVTWTP